MKHYPILILVLFSLVCAVVGFKISGEQFSIVTLIAFSILGVMMLQLGYMLGIFMQME
jgi:predicted permease